MGMHHNDIKNDFICKYNPIFNEIDEEYEIELAGAHLCCTEGDKRIFSYFYPEETAKGEIETLLVDSFFRKEDRAEFFEIINVRSKKKVPMVLVRTNNDEIFNDLTEYKNCEILIPEEVFDLDVERFLKQKPKDLHEYIKPRWEEVENTPRWRNFYKYFCAKMKNILDSDVSENYKPAFEIYTLLSSIMFFKWKYCYFFPTDPPGGFFAMVRKRISDTEVQNLYAKATDIAVSFKNRLNKD